MSRLLGREHHQLLPEGEPAFIGRRQGCGLSEEPAVELAHPDSLEREQRRLDRVRLIALPPRDDYDEDEPGPAAA